jgi:hypothetical protein
MIALLFAPPRGVSAVMKATRAEPLTATMAEGVTNSTKSSVRYCGV